MSGYKFVSAKNINYLRGETNELDDRASILKHLSERLNNTQIFTSSYIGTIFYIGFFWVVAILLCIVFIDQITGLIATIVSGEQFFLVYSPLDLSVSASAWVFLLVGCIKLGKPIFNVTELIVRYPFEAKSALMMYEATIKSRKIVDGTVLTIKYDSPYTIITYVYNVGKEEIQDYFKSDKQMKFATGDKIKVVYLV
jgi:hypothetical protein